MPLLGYFGISKKNGIFAIVRNMMIFWTCVIIDGDFTDQTSAIPKWILFPLTHGKNICEKNIGDIYKKYVFEIGM